MNEESCRWRVEYSCQRSHGHYTVEAVSAEEAKTKAEIELRQNHFCSQGIPCDCTTTQKYLKPQRI